MGIVVNGVKVAEFNDDNCNIECDLREEVRERELKYKQTLRKDVVGKFSQIFFSVMPALIRAILDPTVRSIDVNIVRPDSRVLSNNCIENKSGKLKVSSDNMMQKAIYFEELYRQWS